MRRRHFCRKRQCQSCVHYILNFAHIGFEFADLSPAEASDRFRTLLQVALTKIQLHYGLPDTFGLGLVYVSATNPLSDSFIARTFHVTRATASDALLQEVCQRPAGQDWRGILHQGLTGFILRVQQGAYAKRCPSLQNTPHNTERWSAHRESVMDLREEITARGLLATFQVPRERFTRSPALRFTLHGYTVIFANEEDKRRFAV